jgi:nickel-dependent lactate racemase
MVELIFFARSREESFTVDIPEKNLLFNAVPRPLHPIEDVEAAVERVLDNPVKSKRLEQIAKPDSS